MNELSKTMQSASSPTNIMELVRKLEGIIKSERATFEDRVAEAVALRTGGKWGLWVLCGIVLGNLPQLAVWLSRYFK